MDQCEFLMHFSYNVVGFHNSQCSKKLGRTKKMRKLAKKLASCSYLCRLLSYGHRKSKITMYISDFRTTQDEYDFGNISLPTMTNSH